MSQVVPYLFYRDAPAAIDFLTRAFGFVEGYRFPMDDGRIGHAELALDDAPLMLASTFEGFGTSPLDLPAVHCQVRCTVDDVDAHYERARLGGATIVTSRRVITGRACTARSTRKVIAGSRHAARRGVMPAARTRRAVDRTLLALADPTWRRVVELLGSEPKRAGDIAAGVGVTPPALSRHLRVLHRNGIIEEVSVEHDARVRIYRLRQDPFDGLRDWLTQIEAFWTGQLAAFSAHAARAARSRGESRGKIARLPSRRGSAAGHERRGSRHRTRARRSRDGLRDLHQGNRALVAP